MKLKLDDIQPDRDVQAILDLCAQNEEDYWNLPQYAMIADWFVRYWELHNLVLEHFGEVPYTYPLQAFYSAKKPPKEEPVTKSRAFKLNERMHKITMWMARAEDATTREEAQKALRKVAKHSRKLAELQSLSYYTEVPQKDTSHDQPSTDQADH